jgi:cyclase
MSLADSAGIDVTTRPVRESIAHGVTAFVQMDGSWGLSNAGLVVGDNGVLLIDTWFTERRNDMLRTLVDETSPRPPTMLVNSHHHGDHVYGNGWFPEATVISHEATRSAVLALDADASARRFTSVEFGRTRATPATITFDTEMTLHLGGITAVVSFPGVCHCVGNTVILVEEHSVLFAGDVLLNGCTPALVGGSALGYLTVLEKLRRLQVEVVVPGHGAVCGPEVIDRTERYVHFVLDHARDALARGWSPLDAARKLSLGEFAHWIDSERIVGNLYRAMHELSEADGRRLPMDIPAMWRDTIAWLGRPLSSRA